MASNARSSSSGVRNLRAMFETGSSNAEDSTSPPPRGRSPASESVASNSSARPLSTVRTSFVAVERSGLLKRINGDGGVEGKADMKIGTANKDKSAEGSSGALVNGKTGSQGGNNMTSETMVDRLEKPTSFGEVQKPVAVLQAGPKGKAVVADSAAANEQPPNPSGEPKGAAAALSAAEIPLPDTPKPSEKAKAKMPAKGKAPAPLKSSSEKGKERSVPTSSAAATKPRENVSRPSPAPISISKDASATKPTSKASTHTQTQASRPPARLPRTPTTPNTPFHSTAATTRPRAPPAPTTEPTKVPIKKPSKASMGPPTGSASSATSSRRVPIGSSSSTAPPRSAVQSSPKSKANPKSPTRPARLPTSIIAPTASSAAKTSSNPSSRPHSRESSTLRRQPSTIHKTSKPTPTRPTTTASVRRQPSRPSLPERPHSRDASIRRKSLSGIAAAPDEGFLARMMRPTASSASKTHDKLQEKVHDNPQDKHPEKGDTKVVRKAKSTIKGPTKSSGGEGTAQGEVKEGEPCKTEETKANNSKDIEQEDVSATANGDENLIVHQEEEKASVTEETPKPVEGDNATSEDTPPASGIVPDLPEITPVVAAAG